MVENGADVMPRKVKGRALDSREARNKLKSRGAAYWRLVDRGLHVGYRRIAGKAGTWWARYYAGEQHYNVEPLGTADDVEAADGRTVLDFWQALAKARGGATARVEAPEVIKELTVADAIASYVIYLRSRGKGAADAEIKVRLILPELGSVKLTDPRLTEKIRAWLAKLAETPRRIRTARGSKQRHDKAAKDNESKRKRRAAANRVFTVLRAALNFAFHEGRVLSDRGWKRVKPFEAVDAARIDYLTPVDAQRLLNACEPDFRLLVRAALETGARYSELARVTAGDFNSDTGTVTIGASKTGRARHVVLKGTGTAFFGQLAAGRAGDELLLRKADGQPWGVHQQKARMREACKRAGIVPAVGFHALRHSHASALAKAGTPMPIIAEQLGHTSTKYTVKNYVHFAPSHAADVIREALPSFEPEPNNVERLARR
jgi:integrase